MKTKTTLLLILVILVSMNSHAQDFFSKVLYNGNTYQIQAISLTKTTDNQYVFAGYWEDWPTLPDNGLVVRFDEQGNIIWSKILVSPFSFTQFTDIIPTSDSGVIILGHSESDILLVKMNQQGNIVWAKKSDWEIGAIYTRAICPTLQHGFAIVGKYTETPVDSPHFTFVSTFDESGNHIWTDNFGLFDAKSIVQLPDSSLLVTGDGSWSYLMNLQNDGSVKWFKSINPDSYHAFSLHVTNEGIYSLFKIGNTSLGLHKQDFEFNQEWILQIDLESGSFFNTNLHPKMISTPDSGIIIVNQNNESGNLIKITKDGTISWAKELPFMVADLETIGDSAYIIAGDGITWPVALTRTDMNGNGSDCTIDINITSQFLSNTMVPDNISAFHQYDSFVDFTPVITDFQLTEQVGCVYDFIDENEPQGTLQFVPNPANESFKVEIDKLNINDFIQLEIRDISGRVIYQTNDQSCLTESINLSQLHPGIYQVILMTKQARLSGKLAIAR
ncbi:MAG: T9SS type A sorting domain-containing protein [Bacteroidales bacterium]|nr:T9SS type A sorting domain-containing protein [Bacteroidales bacterium]